MSIEDLPYVQAAGDGGKRPRTQVVVIHATDNTASDESEAAYAAHRADKTSAHLYVDGDSAVRALPLDDVAYGCLYHGNQISVQLELAGLSSHILDATMRQAAPLVAEVCRRYSIPPVKISAAQVRAGVKGICGHADITAAFPEDHGDHTDPGSAFPWPTFINYVTAGPAGGTGAFMALTDAEQRTLYDYVVAMFRGADSSEGVPSVPHGWEVDRQAWQAATDARLAKLAASLGQPSDVTAEEIVKALAAKLAA